MGCEWKGYATSNVGKIKANPDKSKHLETATIRILNTSVDFVNLRKETYSEFSRIPTITIGTPVEDAYRRDLTINSLFYNINTQTIEDFTMRGIDDLAARIVRTPLPALETFIEDPLRLLRVIRFACRYQCSIDPAIMEASKDPGIESMLSRKVSRERVGIELLKMAQGCDFARAMHLIDEMNIVNSVFNMDGDCSNYMRTQKHRTQEEFAKNMFLVSIPIVAEAFRWHVGMRVGQRVVGCQVHERSFGERVGRSVAVCDRRRVDRSDETPSLRHVHQRSSAGGNSRVGSERKVGDWEMSEMQQSINSASV